MICKMNTCNYFDRVRNQILECLFVLQKFLTRQASEILNCEKIRSQFLLPQTYDTLDGWVVLIRLLLSTAPNKLTGPHMG